MRLGPREAAGSSGGFNPGRWACRWALALVLLSGALSADGAKQSLLLVLGLLPGTGTGNAAEQGRGRSGEMVSSSMVGMLGEGRFLPTTESGHVPRMTRSNWGQGPRTEGTRLPSCLQEGVRAQDPGGGPAQDPRCFS